MEDGAVLDLVLEIHQNRILHELRLQKALLVNRTVEEALVTQVPEEVHGVVFGEEVFGEGPGEVSDLVLEQVHRAVLLVVVNHWAQLAMEKREERVVLLQHLV